MVLKDFIQWKYSKKDVPLKNNLTFRKKKKQGMWSPFNFQDISEVYITNKKTTPNQYCHANQGRYVNSATEEKSSFLI